MKTLKDTKKKIKNMILEFFPRIVLQEAQPAKDILEIDTGTLTPCSVKRIDDFYKSKIEELVKEARKDERDDVIKQFATGDFVLSDVAEKFKREIINELVKEIVPEKDFTRDTDEYSRAERNGWNACIDQIQENINKIRGEKMSSSIKPRCGICGGVKTFIRGRTPQNKKRWVCPTCLAERMDYIHDISSEYYDSDCKSPELTQERQERK